MMLCTSFRDLKLVLFHLHTLPPIGACFPSLGQTLKHYSQLANQHKKYSITLNFLSAKNKSLKFWNLIQH